MAADEGTIARKIQSRCRRSSHNPESLGDLLSRPFSYVLKLRIQGCKVLGVDHVFSSVRQAPTITLESGHNPVIIRCYA